jgi:hypothetical protein
MRPTVPPAARDAFAAVLTRKAKHAVLPDPLPLDRSLMLADKTHAAREELRVRAGHDEKGYFLDYYRISNDDNDTTWHARIRADGSVQDLENYEGQFGRRVFPDPAETEREHQRIIAHNAHVAEVLKSKGFE